MSLYDWDFGAPTPSTMGDHDVPAASDRLAGKRIALLVTGGIAAMKAPEVDLWPLFEACKGKPLALIRGANSDLLTQATADEMAERAPDMIYEVVPDRGHIPFLDEPEALSAIHRFLGLLI